MSTNRNAAHPAAVSADRTFDEHAAVNVAAWAEHVPTDVAAARPVAHDRALPIRPTATVTTGDAIRGTTVTLSIPLDEPTSKRAAAAGERQVRPGEPVDGASGEYARPAVASAYLPKKKMIRRDSLERREALLKGKEGSRRRQRWENGQFLSNPWAEPPLPSDWEIQPTYPRVAVPYFLAPLWEADANKRARRQSKVARAKARATVDSRAKVLPRELREKLKRTRSARGLLVDLETQVRSFLEDYYRTQTLRAVDEEEEDADEQEQVLQTDDEDDEIVFVGRQGQMKDMPPSPKARKQRRGRSPGPALVSGRERSGTTTTVGTIGSNSDDDVIEIDAAGETMTIRREKLVFNGPASDQGATFARWIVHSIGDYYGLKTWSVTVGNPAMREAYVGIDNMKTGVGVIPAVKALPQPLWGMV